MVRPKRGVAAKPGRAEGAPVPRVAQPPGVEQLAKRRRPGCRIEIAHDHDPAAPGPGRAFRGEIEMTLLPAALGADRPRRMQPDDGKARRAGGAQPRFHHGEISDTGRGKEDLLGLDPEPAQQHHIECAWAGRPDPMRQHVVERREGGNVLRPKLGQQHDVRPLRPDRAEGGGDVRVPVMQVQGHDLEVVAGRAGRRPRRGKKMGHQRNDMERQKPHSRQDCQETTTKGEQQRKHDRPPRPIAVENVS